MESEIFFDSIPYFYAMHIMLIFVWDRNVDQIRILSNFKETNVYIPKWDYKPLQ